MVGIGIAVAVAHTPVQTGLIVLGSLLPDIDHPTSTLGRYNPLARRMKHRGKCHTVLGAMLLSLPFGLLLGADGIIYVCIGALGHLLADKVNSFLPKRRTFKLRIW